MIRDEYILEDIQKVIVYLFKKMVANTWTRWEVVFGYPEQDVFEKFTKPFIYVLPPRESGEIQHQGGGHGRNFWELIIGLWDDRQTGGMEEINIQASKIHNFFKTPQTCHAQQFDVTIGSTSYANTTLSAQGIRIQSIQGPRELFTEDIKEFRREFTLIFRG